MGGFRIAQSMQCPTFTYTLTRLWSFRYLCTPHSGDWTCSEIVVVERLGE